MRNHNQNRRFFVQIQVVQVLLHILKYSYQLILGG